MCFGVDYDVVVVGTSPLSMIEALYHHYSGEKVLILESAPRCGGAWMSFEVFGIPDVDVGCHLIGHDDDLARFLRDYVGCNVVALDRPEESFYSILNNSGFYFSKGCSEVVKNLEEWIATTDITLLLNHAMEKVSIDAERSIAWIETNGMWLSTAKIIITPHTNIHMDGDLYVNWKADDRREFHHLYLLIEDPTPFRFTYSAMQMTGLTRSMNLTHFVGLDGTGLQLIAIQMHHETTVASAEEYLEFFKSKRLLDPSAKILKAETYVFEQKLSYPEQIDHIKNGDLVFEMLDSEGLRLMNRYLAKWKKVLPKKSMREMGSLKR
jgi:hypothetical protein